MEIQDKYPESTRMKEVSEQSQAIGEFIDWMNRNAMQVCEWVENKHRKEYLPVAMSIEEMLAKYYQINLKRVEEEKQQMLVEHRKFIEEQQRFPVLTEEMVNMFPFSKHTTGRIYEIGERNRGQIWYQVTTWDNTGQLTVNTKNGPYDISDSETIYDTWNNRNFWIEDKYWEFLEVVNKLKADING